jgi:hypothetical protein
MTIRANYAANQWEANMTMDPTGQAAPVAAPGGWAATTLFSEIKVVADTTKCFGSQSALSDLNGQKFSDSLVLGGAGTNVNVLTGFIGNVAQANATPADYLQVYPSGTNAILEQVHTKGPPAPLTLGPLSGESWSYGCTAWSPVYATVPQVVYSQSDVSLVADPQSKTSVCFITGLTGAWSSTRSAGTVQPTAQIYVGAAHDLRLRVSSSNVGSPADSVGAYAYCIQLK